MQPVKQEEASVESWYSIVVCVAICYINAVTAGWGMTSSVLVSELESNYNTVPFVETQASLVTSVCSGIMNFTLILFMFLIRRVGLRVPCFIAIAVTSCSIALSPFNTQLQWWIATYSIPSGLGIACTYASITYAMPLYFDRHLGRMYGTMCLFSGIMFFLMPILWTTMQPLGFKTSLHIFGAMIGSASLFVIFFKPRPTLVAPTTVTVNQSSNTVNDDSSASTSTSTSTSSSSAFDSTANDSDNNSNNDSSNNSDDALVHVEDLSRPLILANTHTHTHTPTHNHTPHASTSRADRIKSFLHLHLFRNKNYMVFAIGLSISTLGISIPNAHITAFAKLYFPNENVDTLVSAMGLGLAGSKLVGAALVDFLPVRASLYYLQASFVCCALTMIAIAYAITTQTHFSLAIAAMAVYGGFLGPYYSMTFPILCRFLSRDSSAIASGYQSALGGVFSLIGPPLAGLLYDMTRSYSLCFFVASIPMFLGSLLMFFASFNVINNL